MGEGRLLERDFFPFPSVKKLETKGPFLRSRNYHSGLFPSTPSPTRPRPFPAVVVIFPTIFTLGFVIGKCFPFLGNSPLVLVFLRPVTPLSRLKNFLFHSRFLGWSRHSTGKTCSRHPSFGPLVVRSRQGRPRLVRHPGLFVSPVDRCRSRRVPWVGGPRGRSSRGGCPEEGKRSLRSLYRRTLRVKPLPDP